jgi:hypothetical protein
VQPSTLHISKDGKDFGEYSMVMVEQMLKNRQLTTQDLYFDTGNNWIDSVSFALQMRQEGVFAPADENAVSRIWRPGMLRLFISHRSEEKDIATKLAKELSTFNVSGFVAHEAIKPSEEWEAEILNGLRSMKAMLVFVTAQLHKSVWCNQEIGFALGRGITIVPICIDGNVPHGFIAKYQGKHTALANTGYMAETIVDTLANNDRTALLMRECLIEGLIHSKSFIDTSALYNRIAALPDLTKEEAERMKKAFTNDQVSNYGASHKIKALMHQHYPRWSKLNPADDEIPF